MFQGTILCQLRGELIKPNILLAIVECLHLILKLMALSVTFAIEGNIQPKATTNSPYACSGMHNLIIFITVELALFYYLITDLSRPP